jgi:histidine ammonia-lyase
VPLRGSVGASGDLCPLAHFALVLIGEGEASVPDGEGRRIVPGARALRHAGLHPLALSYKEGLALINGTTISTACLALALVDAEALARTAEVACALSFEALGAHGRALDPQLHAARRQAGQEDAAAGLRALLLGSTHVGSTDDRQDAYSVRCAPQVLGASRDALSFARHVGETELSAVTDNPLVFALPGDAPPWDLVHHADNPRRFGREPDGTRAYSGGNFHGQPVAVAADVAALATCEIMSIAERRIALLANPATSRGLPAHLAADSGTSSGLMLAQYTAASLVSEGKTLAHPASVDSIPTGAGAEDHVSMSTWAARKARQVVDLATQVVALELLAAAQAVEWRSVLPEPTVEPAGRSRDEWRRLDAAFRGANVADVAAGLGAGAAAAYRAVREISPRVGADRPLAHDVTTLARAVRAGQFVEATAGATRPLRRLVLAPPA